MSSTLIVPAALPQLSAVTSTGATNSAIRKQQERTLLTTTMERRMSPQFISTKPSPFCCTEEEESSKTLVLPQAPTLLSMPQQEEYEEEPPECCATVTSESSSDEESDYSEDGEIAPADSSVDGKRKRDYEEEEGTKGIFSNTQGTTVTAASAGTNRRTIRFNDTVKVISYDKVLPEEVHKVWHTPKALEDSKSEGIAIAAAYRQLLETLRRRRQHQLNQEQEQQELPPLSTGDAALLLWDDLHRGLEGCTVERQRHRQITNRCAIQAHRCCMAASAVSSTDASTVAAASVYYSECARYAVDVALVQAARDYLDAYRDDLVLEEQKQHSSGKEGSSRGYNHGRIMLARHIEQLRSVPHVSTLVPPSDDELIEPLKRMLLSSSSHQQLNHRSSASKRLRVSVE